MALEKYNTVLRDATCCTRSAKRGNIARTELEEEECVTYKSDGESRRRNWYLHKHFWWSHHTHQLPPIRGGTIL